MDTKRMHTLLLEALEHERSGVLIHQAALTCAKNGALRAEWTKHLQPTEEHATTLTEVCEELHLDAEQGAPVRAIVRKLGEALVDAMETALANASPTDAELVACECVVVADTKDHLNWELMSILAAAGDAPESLEQACEDIAREEDEHLYHTKGWCRELWLQALGQPAVLPPPEERHDVKTTIGAARADRQRDTLLQASGTQAES